MARCQQSKIAFNENGCTCFTGGYPLFPVFNTSHLSQQGLLGKWMSGALFQLEISLTRKPQCLDLGNLHFKSEVDVFPYSFPQSPESGILPHWVQNSSLSNTLKISLAFPVMKNVFHRFSEKLKRRLVWKLRLTHFASQLGLAIIATVFLRKLLPQGPIIKASIRQMSAVILGSVFTKFYLDLIPRKKTLSYLFTRAG